MRMSPLPLALAMVVVVWPAAAQRNGPGPRVIEYRLIPGIPTAAVPDRPRLDLGAGTKDDEIFSWIAAVRRQQSGLLLVATLEPIQVRVFDAEGRLRSTLGRKGRGPGEYLDLSELMVMPTDSLVVLDRMSRRLTVLGPDGTYAASASLTPPFPTPQFDVSVLSLGDGTLLIGFAEITATAPSPQPVAVYQHVGRYTTRGVLVQSIGRFFVGEYFLQATPRHVAGGSAFWDRAFSRRGVLLAYDGAIYFSDASALEVRRLDLAGRLIELHRLAVPLVPVTPAMITRYRADALAKASPADRSVEERRVAEMPYPEQLPAFRRSAVDARGRIWLQQYAYPQPAPNRWWVLDPATREARTVLLPDRFVPHAIGRSEITGTWEDDDDVEHVRVYALLY
jgi:hypothetical protein